FHARRAADRLERIWIAGERAAIIAAGGVGEQVEMKAATGRAAAPEVEPPGQGRAERSRRLQPRLGLRLEMERRFELAHRIAADDGEAGRGQVKLVDIEEEFVEQLGIRRDA